MKNIVKDSIKGNDQSLRVLFEQFLDERESILNVGYFGLNGLWHMGFHSFGCLTDRRVCSLKIGWLGHVGYSDAFLEDVNSIRVDQPSIIILYFFALLFLLLTFGIGLLILPLFVKFFYRFHKSGATVNVRSGGSVYIFCDRNKIKNINELLRSLNVRREERLESVFGIDKTSSNPHETGSTEKNLQ